MRPERGDADTIAAIATPPGQGGIGVIRISGQSLTAFTQAWFDRTLPARQAVLLPFHDGEGNLLDEGLAIYFPAPHSYTGEDVLELHAHGNPLILAALLRRCHLLGARTAEPGEFTLRAYLNEKIDLAQAESVADLISANSEMAARSAMQTLHGEFSKRIHSLVDTLIELRAQIEAMLDFPEEAIDFMANLKIMARIDRLRQELQSIRRLSGQGKILRDGMRVVLIGQPNVGKSSLLNRLAGDELAIVSDQAGTTRDTVRETLVLRGVPVQVIDTAGLRETSDTIEQQGIQRTWAAIDQANAGLLLVDAQHGLTAHEQQIIARLPERLPLLTVHNKADLMPVWPEATGADVYVSAKTGEGLDLLQDRLLAMAGWQGAESSQFMARERHLHALDLADTCLAEARQQEDYLELLAENLRHAQESLNRITGDFSADDLLGEIFSRFCIGK